jgi:hypothetical protein
VIKSPGFDRGLNPEFSPQRPAARFIDRQSSRRVSEPGAKEHGLPVRAFCEWIHLHPGLGVLKSTGVLAGLNTPIDKRAKSLKDEVPQPLALHGSPLFE